MAILTHKAHGGTAGGKKNNLWPRKNSAARGYGRRWRDLRKMVLAAEPLCRSCGKLATDVDHIIPRASGGSDSFNNLQPLCKSCHSAKTAEQDGGLGKVKIAAQDVEKDKNGDGPSIEGLIG